MGLGSGAVLVVMIVLGVSGAFSSGSDDGTPSTTTGTTTTANSGVQGFPLTEVQIDDSGDFQDTFEIRRALQPLLPRTQAVYVTLARKQVVTEAISRAVESGQPIFAVKGEPAFTGIVNPANAGNGVIPIPLEAGGGVQGSGAAALGLADDQPFFQAEAVRGRAATQELGLHSLVRAGVGGSR